jgi:hypothetical protein
VRFALFDRPRFLDMFVPYDALLLLLLLGDPEIAAVLLAAPRPAPPARLVCVPPPHRGRDCLRTSVAAILSFNFSRIAAAFSRSPRPPGIFVAIATPLEPAPSLSADRTTPPSPPKQNPAVAATVVVAGWAFSFCAAA